MIYFNVYCHYLKKFFLLGIDFPVGVKAEDLKDVVHDRISDAIHSFFGGVNDLFENTIEFNEAIDQGFIAVECMYYNQDTATCSFTPMTKESFFFEI